MKELLVRTHNPQGLDTTINQFGSVVCQNDDGSYLAVEQDIYPVRALSGNIDFVRFAITNQGYGEVVGEREVEG